MLGTELASKKKKKNNDNSVRCILTKIKNNIEKSRGPSWAHSAYSLAIWQPFFQSLMLGVEKMLRKVSLWNELNEQRHNLTSVQISRENFSVIHSMNL